MSVATQYHAADKVNRSRARPFSETRTARHSPSQTLLSSGQVRRRAEALRRQRIRATRRLVAAGQYDAEDVLDAVLDMVIEDLTS